MTKKLFIQQVANAAGKTQKETDAIVKVVIDTIVANVAAGETVAFPDFGTFAPTVRPAREGHIPSTGEKIQIPEKKTVKFKLAKAFKEALNK